MKSQYFPLACFWGKWQLSSLVASFGISWSRSPIVLIGCSLSRRSRRSVGEKLAGGVAKGEGTGWKAQKCATDDSLRGVASSLLFPCSSLFSTYIRSCVTSVFGLWLVDRVEEKRVRKSMRRSAGGGWSPRKLQKEGKHEGDLGELVGDQNFRTTKNGQS